MIYFLEDDQSIRKFVLYALESVGMECRGFEHPLQFWAAMEQGLPQLILLDIMLPDEDGLCILGKLRAAPKTKEIPVIMLTAKSTEYDKVVGLDGGADDYITKPFGTMELISRIRAVLRRCDDAQRTLSAGRITVCPDKHSVQADGKEVALTLKEYALLCLLIENKGRVFTRDQILQSIWGYSFDGENRTVDVHVKTLRAKLGEAADVVETVRGIGYKIGE